MEEIISSPTARIEWLTPGDRNPEEQGGALPSRKAKAAAASAVRAAAKATAEDLAELAAPSAQEKHRLDELA